MSLYPAAQESYQYSPSLYTKSNSTKSVLHVARKSSCKGEWGLYICNMLTKISHFNFIPRSLLLSLLNKRQKEIIILKVMTSRKGRRMARDGSYSLATVVCSRSGESCSASLYYYGHGLDSSITQL